MTKIIGINGQIATLRETLVSRKNPVFPADLREKDIFPAFPAKFLKTPSFPAFPAVLDTL